MDIREATYRRGAAGILPVFILAALLLLPGCGGESAGDGPYRGANVLLLVIDTLRADHLGCYGYFRDTSPNIDRLAAGSVLFENAYTSIPITLPAHASMLTGRYPQQHGLMRNHGRLDEGQASLAEILREEGYRTGAVVSTAVLKRETGLDRGFDVYLENWGISDKVPPPQEDLAWEYKGLAEDANRLALDWLREAPGKPYFLMINYYDVHAPYVPMEGFKDLFDPFSPEMEEYLRTHYDRIPEPRWKWETITFADRSLAYVDAELEKFFARLEEMGLLEDTIVIVTSDHGNGLYQHDDYWSHGEQLYQGHIRIPLIVRLPGGPSGRVRGLVETVDFAPTILDLLGVQGRLRPDGASFRPLLEGRKGGKPHAFAMTVLEDNRGEPLPFRFAVRGMEYDKVIHTVNGETLFFRLDEDPSELSGGRLPEDPRRRRRAAELRDRGREWYRLDQVAKNRPGEISPERRRELRALGYLH